MKLKEEIENRLREDRRLDASGIEVRVENGRVLLAGTADTDLASALAQENTAALSGVTAVDNRIKVNFPDKIAPPTDAAIHARIQAALSLQTEPAPVDLILVVSDGVVFLDGYVKTLNAKHRINKIAARENGVLSVRNHLLVLPARDRTDAGIDADIRRTLAAGGFSPDSAVRVQVERGVATFEGEVYGDAVRRILNDAAGSVPGVVEIRNRVTATGKAR
jgi:osmotically-inducible protein OsmY